MKRRARFSSRVLLSLGVLWFIAASFGCSEECVDPELNLGERLRITVVGRSRVIYGGACVPLQPGDQFTQTVWGTTQTDLGCTTVTMAPEVPEFFPDRPAWRCDPLNGCFTYREMLPHQSSNVYLAVGFDAPEGGVVDGVLSVMWRAEPGTEPKDCLEIFDVRVEFVDRMSP